MIDIDLDFSGLNALADDLKKLSKAENNQVLRTATREAAKILKDEAVKRAPKRTGKLAKNIVIASKKGKNGDVISGVHIRGRNPLTGNSDNSMKASNKRNAFYWRFVELGTSKMPAVPFIRPAYDAKEEEAARTVIKHANLAIDKVLIR